MLTTGLRSQITAKPVITHLSSDAPPYTGAIRPYVSGGTGPYTYTWSPGSVHTKDLVNKSAGSYTLKVKDSSGDTALFHWNIGYKVQWDQLFGATADADTLGLEDHALVGRGVSRNTLRAGNDGWMEYVLEDMNQIKYIGFTDSLSPRLNSPDDMDYAFTYDGSENKLYVLNHGNYRYVQGSMAAGQVLKIAREGDTVRYYVDQVPVYSWVDVEVAQKDWKIKGFVMDYNNASLRNVGCSFQDPGNSAFPGYLVLHPHVVHSTNSATNDGSVSVSPFFGNQSYNYSWQPGMVKASGIVNRRAGNYAVTASDELLHYSTRTFDIGYKVAWDSLKGARASGDTLRTTTEYGWGSGRSRNKLPAGQDGWLEYILQGPEEVKFIGFVDSLSPYPQDMGDLDHSFYYVGSNWLYIYTGSALSVVSNMAYPGMVLRIGRKGHTIYYTVDGVDAGSVVDSVLTSRDWWIKGVGYSGTASGFVNVGCSFSESVPALSLKLQKEHATAAQPASGMIGIDVSGGVPPYRYYLNGKPAGSALQTGLLPGIYRVTVKDSLNDSLAAVASVGLLNDYRLMRHISLSDSGYVNSSTDSTMAGAAIAYNTIGEASEGFCEITVTEATNGTAFGFLGFGRGALDPAYDQPVVKERSIDSLLVFADSLLTRPSLTKTAEAYKRLNLAYFKDGIVHIAFKDYSLAEAGEVTYAAGDVFRIHRKDGLIRLYKNDKLVATNGIAGNDGQTLLNGVLQVKGRSGLIKNASAPMPGGNWSAYTPGPLCSEPALNWVKTRSFDENGTIRTESKAYMDQIGRPVQNQVKQFSKGNALVSEPLYDSWGRAVGQSLAAPSFQEELCYVSHFIQRTATTAYAPGDFDNLPGTGLSGDLLDAFNALGDVNHPKAVYSGTQGKLGWYYSNNNAAEPLVAADALPYARMEYDDNGRLRRNAGAGTNLGMGSGHENYVIYTSTPDITQDPTTNELNYVFPNGTYELENNFGVYQDRIIHNLQLFKTISINPDGRDQISYTNAAGQTIATCITGSGTGCVSHTEKRILYPQTSREILQNLYVPSATTGSLRLFEESGYPVQTFVTAVVPVLRDLLNNRVLVSGTDYHYNSSTGYFTFSGAYAGKSLYLQLSYSGSVSAGRRLVATAETDYTQWTLYFYDRKGRLLANTSPNDFQCQTLPAVAQRTSTQGSPGYGCNATEGNRVASIDLNGKSKEEGNVWMYIDISEQFSPIGSFGEGEALYTFMSDTAKYRQDSLYFAGDTQPKDSLFLAAQDTTLLPACMFPGDSALAFYRLLDSLNTKVPVNALRGKAVRFSGEYVVYARYTNNSLSAEPLATMPYDFTVSGTGATDNTGSAIIHGYSSGVSGPGRIKIRIGDITPGDVGGVVVGIRHPKVDVYGFGNGEESLPGCEQPPTWLPGSLEPVLNGIGHSTQPTINVGVYTWPAPLTIPLANKYMYDEYDRLVGSINEDQGTVYYVYDQKEDKLLFTQNQKQRDAGGKFSCIVYDALGRPVVSGEYDPANGGPTTGDTPFLFQDYYTWKGGAPVPSGRLSTGAAALANSAAYNDGHIFDRTFIEYDNADASLPTNFGTVLYYKQSYTAAKVSKTWNDQTTTWYSYDELGRQAWSVQQSAELGYKTMRYNYDMRGKLLASGYNLEGGDNLIHNYIYDADERLSTALYGVYIPTIPVTPMKPLASYEYYLHGPLKRTELGNKLQGLDYVYTIDGKLKAVNNPMNGATGSDPGLDGYSTGPHAVVSPDAFAYALEYYPGDYVRSGSPIHSYNNTNAYADNLSYSGLVKAQSWRTVLPAAATNNYSNALMYEYRYDEQYRLTGATFGTVSETTPGAGSHVFTQKPEYRLENIAYDKNGNLQSLKRYAAPINSSTAHLLDNLTYNYSATKKNKLEKIADAATNTAGYSAELDLPNQTNSSNYVYNSIGELVENKQEDRGYEYNSAGLVTRVYKLSNGQTIVSYTYNDKGLKHRNTTYISGTAVKDIYYSYDAGGAQVASYTRDLLAPAPSTVLQNHTLYGAGRVGLLDKSTGKALFELSDHLGNVRAVVAEGISTNLAEVLSYTDYYPHGGIMPGRNYQSSLNFPYGYQGQEKDAATGLTNFELRQYDPRIGRWYNPDPMGQHHSPYLAMSNNPVSFTDPDGGWDGDGWDFGIGVNWASSSSYSGAEWASMSVEERTAAFKHYGTGTSFSNYLYTDNNGNEHMANSGQGLADLYNKYNDVNWRSVTFDSDKKQFRFSEFRHTDLASQGVNSGDISDNDAKGLPYFKNTRYGWVLSKGAYTYVNDVYLSDNEIEQEKKDRENYRQTHKATGAIKQSFAIEEFVIGGTVIKGATSGFKSLFAIEAATKGVNVAAEDMVFTAAQKEALMAATGYSRTRIINGTAVIDQFGFFRKGISSTRVNLIKQGLRNNGATSIKIYTNAANAEMKALLRSRMSSGRELFGLTIKKRILPGYILKGGL